MQYKKIKIGSYNLHLVKTNKFKTIFLKIIFRDEVKKEEITKRNLLFHILSSSSKKYKTERLMNIAREELYNLDIMCTNYRVGNHILSELSFSFLDEKHSEKGVIKDSISFMKEIVFNPNINNDCFDKNTFETYYQNEKNNILMEKDYGDFYALQKVKELMNTDKPFSFKMMGYLKDLEKVNAKNLKQYYDSVLNTNIVDIYMVGDISFTEIEKIFRQEISFNQVSKQIKPIVEDYVVKTDLKTIIEKSNYNQTRLMMGLSFEKLSKDEKKYIMLLYNTILGNSPESRLFNNVREKKSLAYNISSSYSKNDGIMVIITGIDCDKYEVAIEAIKEELLVMQNGGFTNEELTSAKKLIISSLKEFEDFPSAIAEYYFAKDYLGNDDAKTAIKKIQNVTKEEIMNIAQKIKIDLIYLLKEQL